MPVNQQAHICPQKSVLLEDLPRDNHFMNSAMEPPEDDRWRNPESRWIEPCRIAGNLTSSRGAGRSQISPIRYVGGRAKRVHCIEKFQHTICNTLCKIYNIQDIV